MYPSNCLVFYLQLQVLSEVRSVIRARDLNRFNELTVHREIAAKKVCVCVCICMLERLLVCLYVCMCVHSMYVCVCTYVCVCVCVFLRDCWGKKNKWLRVVAGDLSIAI